MGLSDGSIGIGLAIVRRIAAPFGELIWDEGNLFVFFLID